MTTLATQLDQARMTITRKERVIQQMQGWIDDYLHRIARQEAEVAALRQSKVRLEAEVAALRQSKVTQQ